MEQLLHYVWKHRLLPLGCLSTTAGQAVEVIDPGLYNTNAGPDFFNAKIRIDGTVWVGNVEMHVRSSDWFLHGHQIDARYNNVILHVAETIDADVVTESGARPPQMQLAVPQNIIDRYAELSATDKYPPCYRVIPHLDRFTVHSWMSALQTGRLEQKTQAIGKRLDRCGGSWEAACFVTLARNYGFGVNGDAFEAWAYNIPLHDVAHHRDDIFQVEAIFMGQAGLLDAESISERHRAAALNDEYYQRLKGEYGYLAHKFGLKPIDFNLWKFLRLRPQNFPHIRLAQLAQLYCGRKAGLSGLLECTTVKELAQALQTCVTPYWKTHYTFAAETRSNDKRISAHSIELIIVNTVVPMLFAYGRYKSDEALCDRAFSLLEQLKAEDNHIIRMWRECGLEVDNAGDSQALIQLKNNYCDRHDCLRCRFGYEYLKGR